MASGSPFSSSNTEALADAQSTAIREIASVHNSPANDTNERRYEPITEEQTDEEAQNCVICQDSLYTTTLTLLRRHRIATTGSCDHQNHYKCMMRWFTTTYNDTGETDDFTCPTCRGSVEQIYRYRLLDGRGIKEIVLKEHFEGRKREWTISPISWIGEPREEEVLIGHLPF